MTTETQNKYSFELRRKEFAEALDAIAVAVPESTSIAAMFNMLVSCKDNIITLKTTNSEMIASCDIPVLAIKPEHADGVKMLIDFEKTRIFVNSQIDDDVHISFDGNKTTLRYAAAKLSLNGDDPNNLPLNDTVVGDNHLSIPVLDLVSALKFVAHARLVRGHVSMFTGVSVSVRDGAMHLVGAEQRRIASCKIRTLSNNYAIWTFILPPKIVMAISSLRVDDNRMARLSMDKNKLAFNIGNYTLTSGFIEGEYPDVSKILSMPRQHYLTVNAKRLNDAFKVAAVCATPLDKMAALNIMDTKVSVTSKSQEADYNTDIDADVKGESVSLMVDYELAGQAFEACGDVNVKIEYGQYGDPIFIIPEVGERICMLATIKR